MATVQGKGFSVLPTELIQNVFVFIGSHSDRSAVSLVCRLWNNAVARIMWATFTTDLDEDDFSELLLPDSRIVSHIRSLEIRDMVVNDAYQSRLQQLIGAISGNRLRAFSNSEQLTLPTLKCLLERHKTLEDLHLTDLSNLPLSEHMAWMASTLAFVTIFTLDLPSRLEPANTSLRRCRTLIKHMPRLTCLIIVTKETSYPGSARPAEMSNLLRGGPGTLNLCNLRTLVLSHVNLSSASDLLVQQIDFTRIRTLQLIRCNGIGTLLEKMTIFYSTTRGAALRNFGIIFDHSPSPDHVIKSVEDFLAVCPTLERLYINVPKAYLVQSAPIIAQHAKTLHTLTLFSGQFPVTKSGRRYSVADIRSLIGACVNLQRIEIDLPEVDLGHVKALGADFRINDSGPGTATVKTEIELVLEAMSAHPHLHTLRIFDLPIINYSEDTSFGPRYWHECMPVSDKDINMTQTIFQHFAEQVLQFLDSGGSKIRKLKMESLLQPVVPLKKDVNGHRWPSYTYTKGRVMDSRGVGKVVALPLAK